MISLTKIQFQTEYPGTFGIFKVKKNIKYIGWNGLIKDRNGTSKIFQGDFFKVLSTQENYKKSRKKILVEWRHILQQHFLIIMVIIRGGTYTLLD